MRPTPIWKEALYNPEVARQLTVAAKGGVATPIQLKRLHNYLLTVGGHDEGRPWRSPKHCCPAASLPRRGARTRGFAIALAS